MRLMDTKQDLTSGGGTFFRLGEGQTAQVRFLYNSIEDIKEDGLIAHVIRPEESGQKYNTEILCGAKSDETKQQDCPWCAQNKKQVGRYPLALYNEATNQIEYWSKTQQWVEGSLITLLENAVQQGQPIAGQSFKIIRTGTGTNTQYTILPQGQNDGKQANQFGEVKPPVERNCYRPTDYEFPVSANGGANFNAGNNYNNNYGNNNNYGGNNYNNSNANYNIGNNNFQSNRRTTDVF